jgi:hypothetical protein
MNCETVAEHIGRFVSGNLRPEQLVGCKQHIAGCPRCADALRGAEALALLKRRDTGDAPAGLFEKMSNELGEAAGQGRTGHRFWLGTGFGGAIAASLFALALALGWIGTPTTHAPEVAEFMAALSEPRSMNVAIETDRPLEGARISILLSGGIELDGYGSRREVTWNADLQAGVNRLTLPVIAVDQAGGQIVVRLSHPHSEQVFVVRLKTDV